MIVFSQRFQKKKALTIKVKNKDYSSIILSGCWLTFVLILVEGEGNTLPLFSRKYLNIYLWSLQPLNIGTITKKKQKQKQKKNQAKRHQDKNNYISRQDKLIWHYMYWKLNLYTSFLFVCCFVLCFLNLCRGVISKRPPKSWRWFVVVLFNKTKVGK